MENNFGFLSIAPVLIVIALVIITKRTMACLIIGSIIASIIAYGVKFFSSWVDALYAVLSNPTYEWIVFVCGLFGSLVALFHASNCVARFSDIAYRLANTRKKSLVTTFLLCVVIFVDDWLAILVVSNAMKTVTDKHKVPREFLAYIIAANGANVCIMVPFSTWSAFFAGQFEANGICPPGESTSAYISTIPFLFFSYISMIVCLLIVSGILPVWGPMKKAMFRAEHGMLLPEGYETPQTSEEAPGDDKKKSNPLNFILPLIILAVVTVVTKEMLYGVLSAIFACAVLYFSQRLVTFSGFCMAMMNGFKDMVGMLGIVFAAFTLRVFNDTLGLADYVIGLVKGNVSAALLPAACFVILSALFFAAGNFWGMAAISFPVVIPMGLAAGANMTLMASAVVCSATFGSTACFYGTEVSLICPVTQITNVDYAKTVLPILAVPFLLTVVLFCIMGFVL